MNVISEDDEVLEWCKDRYMTIGTPAEKDEGYIAKDDGLVVRKDDEGFIIETSKLESGISISIHADPENVRVDDKHLIIEPEDGKKTVLKSL